MADLFGDDAVSMVNTKTEQGAYQPLADRLRPRSLDQVVGQDHLTAEDGVLGRMVQAGQVSSLIFWGPPGTGKTTLANILAKHAHVHFEPISAIFSGVAELKRLFQEAHLRRTNGITTVLFVDEIHRFNRAQQDSFLPVMENGTIILIGATTENPSFELNAALLSRAQVLILNALDEAALAKLLRQAEIMQDHALPLNDDAKHCLIGLADGDGRYLLGVCEQIWRSTPKGEILDVAGLEKVIQRRVPKYDKAQDGHYNLISALHKSVRGSDVDAALYYFTRMLTAGEDPRYLARRLIRMAAEDIGLADPQALQQTIAAQQAYLTLGSPEGELCLAQAVVYLATAPKSNALYVAYKAAMTTAQQTGSPTPPKIILNAPTKLMKQESYGEGYIYDHDMPQAFSGQNYFPADLGRHCFYTPTERGFEHKLSERMAYWAQLREKLQNSGTG